MKLKVLGSGSSGNCYLLENEKECLVIEAGLPLMEVKKAIDFNISKIVGVISGHVHSDHNKYLSEFKKIGINSVCFGKEFPEYDADKMKHYQVRMGNFIIKIFPLIHDVPCYGFHITHPDIGSLVYASDTQYIKWQFDNVIHFLVEANYSKERIDEENPKFAHVLSGHMNIETTLEFLKANNNSHLRNVILCHLSAESADSVEFKQRAEQIVDCDVNVARKGLEINIDLIPF